MNQFENELSDDLVMYTYYMVYGSESGSVYQITSNKGITSYGLFTKSDADECISQIQHLYKEKLIPVECKVIHQDIFFVKAMKNLQYTKPDDAIQFKGEA